MQFALQQPDASAVFRAAAASQLSSEQPTRALNSQEKDACIGSLSLKLYRLTVAQAGHQLCGGLRHTHREVKSVAIWDGGQGDGKDGGKNIDRFSRLAFRTGRSKFGILVRRDRKITPPAKIDASWFAWHHACWIDGHAPPTPPHPSFRSNHVITATIAVCCAACNTTSRGVAGAYK